MRKKYGGGNATTIVHFLLVKATYLTVIPTSYRQYKAEEKSKSISAYVFELSFSFVSQATRISRSRSVTTVSIVFLLKIFIKVVVNLSHGI